MSLLLLVACSPDPISLKPSVYDDTGTVDHTGDTTETDTGPGTDPGTDPGDPVATPAACAEIRADNPGATDGEYTLYLAGDSKRPWTVWCADMKNKPLEYLPLKQDSLNYSQYTAGNAAGTSVRTVYSRLRFDPATLRVDISDQRFSTSTGSLTQDNQKVTSMPFGVAMACDPAVMGEGKVDVSGTGFRVAANAFVVDGYRASGSATYSPNAQKITLVGGGYCGWIAPGLYDPINNAGDFLLSLEYVGN